ncbi:hypothetical protein EDI_272000 [Entamoeba dispar SAW760]|uniref:PPM-type phosphatase domain-containing protein n=1 Tax=Entamoeba dispar (strain ATCC PRA-260 / SAW760) TaxID=370354 RepID=B0EFK2_ENTDS|nr:uncharacterized protein EDI_272000 [Entamoeba dispar SAW760]EDR26684.1 hypothetical protein EDI_272000 [Entamoeba dispar SAW760]|eukprot:EDR26684.1 hypothetical protein EDI_272000 [Entamoeba dispar SAW760]
MAFHVDKTLSKLFKTAFEKQKEESYEERFITPDTTNLLFHNISPSEEKTPEEYFIHYSKYYANVCFSTYPVMNGAKFGKPIADCTMIDVYKNMVIMSIADGCGMGSRPAKSARVACEKFSEYITSEVPKEKTIDKVLRIINDSMAYVQENILLTEDSPMDAGLTTFQGVVVLRVDSTTFAVCYVNIGDCRGLLVHRTNEKCEELVEGYSTRVDVKTTGGRLGPVEGEQPELDNYRCGVQFVQPGTSIIIMTDGICDNFDIRMFNDSPKDCGLPGEEWSDDNSTQTEKRKQELYQSLITLYLEPSLVQLCQNVYDFVVDKTQEQRTLKIEASKTKSKTPNNQILHGKMDHSTLCVLVLNDGLFTKTTLNQLGLEIPNSMKV